MPPNDISGIRIKFNTHRRLRRVVQKHRLRSTSDAIEVLLRGFDLLDASQRRAAIERGRNAPAEPTAG